MFHNLSLPSGALFDVATTTTPLFNSSVNNLFSIIASAISVTYGNKKVISIQISKLFHD